MGREISVGNKLGYILFIDGFVKDDIMLFIMRDLQAIGENVNIERIQNLINKKIAYVEVESVDEYEKIELFVLSGAVALFIDGFEKAVIIDARTYPARSPEESSVEKVTRGSRDGFVETMIFNTALIRRRVRDNKLIFNIKTVGTRSKTDVVIGYIDDLADKKLLKYVEEKISSIKVSSLLMAEKSLEELLIKKRWFNPLPQVRFTERPDVVSSHLLEGNIVIIVDTSPSVMLIPTTYFYFTQYAEDYYQNPLVGTFTRIMRFLAIFISVHLTPIWLILAEYTSQLPDNLKFLGISDVGKLPVIAQLLLLELGIELIKMSSLHTPNNISGSLGIIGGLIIGDLAITVGYFTTESIFYSAVVAIATLCISNVEFAYAMRIFRLFLLILSAIFGIWGLVAGEIIIILITYFTKTIDHKRRYLWPLFPFNYNALKNVLLRRPVKEEKSEN